MQSGMVHVLRFPCNEISHYMKFVSFCRQACCCGEENQSRAVVRRGGGWVGTCGVPSKARLIYASAREEGVDGLGETGKGRKERGGEERAREHRERAEETELVSNTEYISHKFQFQFQIKISSNQIIPCVTSFASTNKCLKFILEKKVPQRESRISPRSRTLPRGTGFRPQSGGKCNFRAGPILEGHVTALPQPFRRSDPGDSAFGRKVWKSP